MRKNKGEDALVWAAVAAALAVLAVTGWVGGRRLYARWQSGRPAPTAPVERPSVPEDGVDRPPTVIPPLAMVGIAPAAKPPRNRPKPPAALPMPPITPDRR
ncbi:hypothetical protein EPO15_13620 [bacterium]|nr:MAG: hypothetical protein EPO15_13620 [bacterium]